MRIKAKLSLDFLQNTDLQNCTVKFSIVTSTFVRWKRNLRKHCTYVLVKQGDKNKTVDVSLVEKCTVKTDYSTIE